MEMEIHSLAQTLGFADVDLDTLLELHRRQLEAGRLKDASETIEVLSTLCPLDSKVWRAFAKTAAARGKAAEAAMLMEVASWFE